MKWKKYTLETTTEAVDFISCLFDEIGIEGIEVEDCVPLTESETRGMFIDILPQLPPDEGKAKVSFYLGEDSDSSNVLAKVAKGLDELKNVVDIGAGTILSSETEDQDWVNNWKQYFKPFTVGNFLVKPTWEEVTEEYRDKRMIQIDPGTAFGTGQHETTQLCLLKLEQHVTPGISVLDVGTGSGILGIAAVLLGARKVFGTDLDENAVSAVAENLEANGITKEQFQVVQGNLIEDEEVQKAAGFEAYDVAVANILADVIIALLGEIAVHLKKGGVFIASGIIDFKEEAVIKVLESDGRFQLLSVDHQGDWACVTARKR